MQIQDGTQALLARQTRILRFQATLLALILILLAALSIAAYSEITRLRGTMAQLETALMAVDAEELNDTIDSLNQAAQNLQSVDVQTLNDLVNSLNDATQSLQAVFDGLSILIP